MQTTSDKPENIKAVINACIVHIIWKVEFLFSSLYTPVSAVLFVYEAHYSTGIVKVQSHS